MTWAHLHRRYPGLRERAYLDTACKGIPPPEVESAVQGFCRRVRAPRGRSATDDSVDLLGRARTARQEVAALIHAGEEEIALVDSTQHGLIIALDAIGLRAGDVVVTCDLEFLATLVPLRALDRRGVDVVVVPHRAGCVRVADIAGAITRRTRAVVVSSVQEVHGQLVNLAALSQLCRSRGVFLVVDAVQHIGPVPLDVRHAPIDFLAVGGHKWLCSPFGLGFLYVRHDLVGRLQPTYPGYMALETPDAGWADFLADPGRSWEAAPPVAADARRFETGGTPDLVGATALAAAASTLRQTGLARIQERTHSLVSYLATELSRLGFEIVTPRRSVGRTGILCFRCGRKPEENERLLTKLLDSGVNVSLRYASGVGGIRVSPYFYNTDDDVCRLFDVTRRHTHTSASKKRSPANSREGTHD